MEFIKDIDKSTIIITTNSYKKEIIKQKNKLIDIKVFTLNEFIKEYTFNYNDKTLLYLMEKYNIKYNIAKIYLENMYYIENKIYNSEKLNKLSKMKEDLINNNMLIINKNFKEYIKEKNIVVYNIKNINKVFKEKLNEIKNIKFINDKQNNYNHKVYELETIEDEITFVASSISQLINQGIDINNIKIANLDSEYKNPIIRIFKLFNINIELNNTTLYGLDITQDFIKNYDKDIENPIKIINEKYPKDEIYNELINVINELKWCNDYNEVKEIFIEKTKEQVIETKKYLNKVEEINFINDYISEKDYVFLLNFNQGSIPKIIKDESYITDNIKSQVGLSTTIEDNIIEKEITKEKIKNIKNLVITYKNKSLSKTFYPSSLIKEMYLEVEKPIMDKKITYSKLNDKIKLTKCLDKFIKYGEKEQDLSLLYNNYKDIKYLSYDNSYQRINNKYLIDHINNKLNLSYTSLDNYFKCSFKYYLTNILKLNKYEFTFYTLIGNIYHHVLEKGLQEEIDIEEEIKLYLEKNKINLTNKEKFFLKKLTNNLTNVLEVIKKQMTFINLKESKYEEKIIINKEDKINITITGIIDKILYQEENNKLYLAVIDYKTGNIDLDLKYIENGIGLQLPMYLYLIKESSKGKEIIFTGLYLQKILKNSSEEEIFKDLKLQGYSNFDNNIIEKFDKSFKDSEIISGLKVKNDGNFYSTSKVLNNTEIDKIIQIVKDNINIAIDNIVYANFDINPKKIENGTNIGCEYCNMKDICYRKDKNIQIIASKKDLSFLGGEIDA